MIFIEDVNYFHKQAPSHIFGSVVVACSSYLYTLHKICEDTGFCWWISFLYKDRIYDTTREIQVNQNPYIFFGSVYFWNSSLPTKINDLTITRNLPVLAVSKWRTTNFQIIIQKYFFWIVAYTLIQWIPPLLDSDLKLKRSSIYQTRNSCPSSK